MKDPLQRPGWLNCGPVQLNSVFWLSLLSGCPWSGAKNSNSLFTWLDCKEIKLIYPKGNQSWIFMERTDAEAEVPILGHLIWRTDLLENILILAKIEGRRRKGWQRKRWLDGITINGHEFERAPGVGDGQGSLVCCSPWCHKESGTIEWLKWTDNLLGCLDTVLLFSAFHNFIIQIHFPFSLLLQNKVKWTSCFIRRLCYWL